MRNILTALAALFLAMPAAAQIIVAPPAPGAALPSPEWPYQPADGDKGPAVGGRAYQRYRVAAPIASPNAESARTRRTEELARLATPTRGSERRDVGKPTRRRSAPHNARRWQPWHYGAAAGASLLALILLWRQIGRAHV